MRALVAVAAVASLAVSGALSAAGVGLTAAGFRLPASAAGLPAEARLSAVARSAEVGSAKAGSIRGRVDVRVGPPADVRPDPASLGMASHRDAQDRRRSVVYLETAPRGAFEPPSDRRARMNQLNERFIPPVLAITAGTWVDFPNGDRTYHNVFSLSKTKEFNLGRYAAGHSESVKFDQPGVVRVFCEIHSHMNAFILVFAHRFFAMTDDEGRYRIDGVPPGTYTLVVWNEAIRGDPPKRSITMGETGDIDADFTIR
jgi:plastocyanin